MSNDITRHKAQGMSKKMKVQIRLMRVTELTNLLSQLSIIIIIKFSAHLNVIDVKVYFLSW